MDYDGNATSGYRDINIQHSFSELDCTAFQGFVFELQIHLRDVLALKSDKGHKLYIKLRNLKGD